MRLQPIRVYCLHHVSDSFDESTMYSIDWLQTDVFKSEIDQLRNEEYEFISLEKATEHLKHDWFRHRKYAVLTADDGWASMKNILPWLDEQHIPITLFLNPPYLDGQHFREKETEKYLSWDDIREMATLYPHVSIGSHGWEHTDATLQTIDVFKQSIKLSKEALQEMPNYIPYYAFPYGKYNSGYIAAVEGLGLTPLLVSGNKNIIYSNYIDRELLGLHK
jgi:peptidoglycan/xylan/chitin deacetylase (PgdA/CDA1 family)